MARARLGSSGRSRAGSGAATGPPRLHRGDRLRAGLRLESSSRDLIRDYLLQRVEHGTVRNRHEAVDALREAGLEVPRQCMDYITALDPETGDRWRLKGDCTELDSNANDLTARLRRRLENERREIEELTASELERLGENSRRIARNALRSIECDTEEAVGRMRELLVKGVAPAADRRHGSLARHLRRKLGDDAVVVEEHSEPDRGAVDGEPGDRAGGREMLAESEETTWGVGLREVSGELYVTLPARTPILTAFIVDGRPYVELSRE